MELAGQPRLADWKKSGNGRDWGRPKVTYDALSEKRGGLKMPRHDWRYHDDLAVLYLKVKFRASIQPNHPAVVDLADAMGTTKDSICLRKSNFDFLESETGVSNAAKQTKEVWRKYEEDPDGMYKEAESAFLDLVGIDGYEASEPIYAIQVGEPCRCSAAGCDGNVYSTCREDCEQCLVTGTFTALVGKTASSACSIAKACRCGDCGLDESDDED